MEQDSQKDNYQEREFDLLRLINILLARKFLIFGLTGFITLLSIIYSLSLTPIYKVTTSITSPSNSAIMNINKLELTSETKKSIFADYLTTLSSQEFQKKVFDNGGYLTALNPENLPIGNEEKYISDFLSSIYIESPVTNISKTKKIGNLVEKPYLVSMLGSDAELISRYLNELVETTDKVIIKQTMDVIEQKIDIRLDQIFVKRELLLDRAEQERLFQIKRINEADSQKIREINDQIDRARYRAKQSRLNQIVALTDSLKLAKSLGIIENNFSQLNSSGVVDSSSISLQLNQAASLGGLKEVPEENNFSQLTSSGVVDGPSFTLSLGGHKEVPEWYLYGEKALQKKIELLENRSSDDPFIPELIYLKNLLNKTQNNNLLKTLKVRKDDSPFMDEILKLDIEKIKLESATIDLTGVSAIQLNQVAITPTIPIKSNNRLIVLLTFIGSFMMSILLVLFMTALKPDELAQPA